MKTAFIDGSAGTTGLLIDERLARHPGVMVQKIAAELRKDPAARAAAMNAADVVFLCLPDAAAREAAALITNPKTVVIDASTAHRVTPGWVYGMAELAPAQREALRAARRIANPGCHATGFLAAVKPLVALGLVAPDYPFTCFSVSGYSGAGKAAIAEYRDEHRPEALDSPRQYALGLMHKHLPEMTALSGLAAPPVFSPLICDYYRGMAVTVPLIPHRMKRRMTPVALLAALEDYYAGNRLIHVLPERADGFIPSNAMAGRDDLTLYVQGHDGQMALVALFDNLGKGAAGAAVQNMNLALGFDEYEALTMGGEEIA